MDPIQTFRMKVPDDLVLLIRDVHNDPHARGPHGLTSDGHTITAHALRANSGLIYTHIGPAGRLSVTVDDRIDDGVVFDSLPRGFSRESAAESLSESLSLAQALIARKV